jgi:hypothetical protein
MRQVRRLSTHVSHGDSVVSRDFASLEAGVQSLPVSS